MILCEICNEKEKTRVHNGRYCCDSCHSDRWFFPYSKFTTCLRKGDFQNVSNERLKEMDRRIILPDDRKDGVSDYYVGRIGENGKIQYRTPDITT